MTELIPGVQVEESGSFENWLESFVESVVPAVTANGSKSPSLPLPEANVSLVRLSLSGPVGKEGCKWVEGGQCFFH